MSVARDLVFVRGLRVDAVIGVYAWERGLRQTLLIDLDMEHPIRAAGASDCLGDALDYEAVSVRLAEYVAQTDFMLVETLAECCADLILTEFGAKAVRLKLSKPDALANAAAVGVEIERGSFS